MSIAHTLLAPLRWLGALLRLILGEISWRPVPWQAATGASMRAKPWHWLGGALAFAGLAWGGHWLYTRPKPVDPEAITFTVEAPTKTDYTQTPPTVLPLTINFSSSAAPIELIEKAPVGITMTPDLAGTWLWRDDTHITFQPASDWPVGTHFKVRFDAKALVAPKVKLAEDRFEFDTAPFVASFDTGEFYQDPQDPNLKKGAFTVAFTHPVDVAAFERLLRFEMADGAGKKLDAPAVVVSYDERKLKAFVQSAPLTVPENGGNLHLYVDAGAVSALGGPRMDNGIDYNIGLPSLYSVEVNDVNLSLADNERFEPEQVMVVDFNDSLRDRDVNEAVRLYLLPEFNDRQPVDQQSSPYAWSTGEVDEATLKKSKPITLSPIVAEREYVTTHSFRYEAPPGRYVYARINRGLRSFGGFLLGKPYATTLSVPAYPEMLRFVGDGALLSLKGEQRVTVAARNVPGLRVEIARVLPDQLQHLIKYNSGSYGSPSLYEISTDSLTERFDKRIALTLDSPAKTHYEGIDLGEYFSANTHGVFLLRLYRFDPENEPAAEPDRDPTNADESSSYDDSGDGLLDSRLVVLTDLGMVSKRALDGQRNVFVMSLAQGTPSANAKVSVIARNGETLLSETTDEAGQANLPPLGGFRREKEPVMLTVARDGDLSFLPLGDSSRTLELSRFDVGGEINALDPGKLKGYLFSERGLYRPGDTIHIGMIVRAQDWDRPIAGLPLEFVLTDPRGTEVRREQFALGDVGFEEQEYTPADTAPTGSWEAGLYLIGEHQERTQLGTTTVQVRDFVPDRMRVRVRFSEEVSEGWVKPDALKGMVKVENLFGTPAQDRRVTATLMLQPAYPSFPSYPGYNFYDPQRAKDGYTEELTETTTDANGDAELALDLAQYDRATYQLRLLTEAFESGGGRGVTAQTGVLVSSNAYLVGLRAQDSLSYVQRGAARKINLIAIDAQAKPTAVEGLRAVLIERHYVSVLTKQDSGLYKYVSQLRSDERARADLSLGAKGLDYTLKTDTPGDYRLEIRDSADLVVNSVDYSVAGEANLTRSLDRNAELQLSLDKGDFKPGEEIELSVRAPYTGAGLITIERERVFAHQWFRADTTSSIQRIRVPEGLEGNAYVNVQFVRDPTSSEIYMSPLSYGVAPFTIDRGARRQGLSLKAPAVVKPGAVARFALHSDGPARVAVFAVDEGILQVARYQLGDPLDFFFTKKMLQVDTAQILDLILPEFSKLAGVSAPGGDAEGALAKHLNPFKRKGDKPAVYWSGLTDIDGDHDFDYAVPDSFNGKLRVMTVAVSSARIGIEQGETLVRGDFVLSPNAPLQVAPGDEFEVSAGVANTIESKDTQAMPIKVSLKLPPSLTLVGDATQQLSLAPGNEGTAKFRVKAGQSLGAPVIVFEASSGKYNARRSIDLSLRPGIVYRTDVRVGSSNKAETLDQLREMFPELSKNRVSTSVSPLVLADGLSAYLRNYPHYCSEQLLSQAFPALVFTTHPEFGKVIEDTPGDRLRGVLAMLRERTNGDGSVGLWSAMPDNDPFVSSYAAFYLVEARDRGQIVPDDLLTRINGYLTTLAADQAITDLSGVRDRAMAIYVLTRQGRTTTNLLASLQEQVDRDLPEAYRTDATAMFLAASYQLLKQDKPARALIRGPVARVNEPITAKNWLRYASYYDDGIASAWTVYLLSKHFPQQRGLLTTAAIERLIEPVRRNLNNTLSSALMVLALDVWGSTSSSTEAPRLYTIDANKQRAEFGDARGLLRMGTFDAKARAIGFAPAGGTIGWYSMTQSGFDIKPPTATQNRGVEVIRDYLDSNGKPVTALTVGDEIDVRLRVRALDADSRGDIAIVDLLPGGFEIVMQEPAPDADSAADEGDDESEGDGEESEGEAPAPPAAPTLAVSSTLSVQHEEVREDRVVLYAYPQGSVSEYRYRIKATAIGQFVVPPAFAESMYERDVYAQGGPAGTLTVNAPAAQ